MRRFLTASILGISCLAPIGFVACHSSVPITPPEADDIADADAGDAPDAADADDGAYRPNSCLPDHFSLPACTWDAASYGGCLAPVRAFIACEKGTLGVHCDNCSGVETPSYDYSGCCVSPCRLDEISVSCPRGATNLPAGCHPDGPNSPGGGAEMCCPCL